MRVTAPACRDSGICAACAVNPSASPRYVDNGNGTITDRETCLVWEKKDQAGGLHDVTTGYSWAGLCGCASGFCAGSEPLCQPNAAAENACNVATGSALGCAQCTTGDCNVDPYNSGTLTTIWDWLVQLNAGAGFAGHKDWRLPTSGGRPDLVDPSGQAAELESIQEVGLPYDGSCMVGPSCVDAATFDTNCSPGCSATGTPCSCTASYYHWSASTYATFPQFAWAVSFSNGFVYGHNKGTAYYVRAVR